MNLNKLLIIIPVYNGKKYLPSLIESLKMAYEYWPNFSVLMINDQSTDESRQIIDDYKFSWLTVNDNAEKKFFVGSCNFGLEKAINEEYDYVFLLNQDTEVTVNVFEKLCEVMDQDSSIGAMQPTVLLHPQTELLNSQGCAIHVFGLGYTLGHKTPYVKDDKIVEVAYPTGAAVLYRTKALSEVGVLASKYEMYHEDLELGWRLWLAGWRCVCLTGVSVFHKHEFSRSISRIYYMERNRWLFVLSRYSRAMLLLLAPGFIMFEFVIILLSIKNSWFKQKLKTYMFFLKADAWRFIFFERRQMKNWLKVSDRKLLHLLTPVVKYQDLGDNMIVDLGNTLIKFYWRIVKKVISI